MDRKAVSPGVTQVTESEILRKTSFARASMEAFAQKARMGHFGHRREESPRIYATPPRVLGRITLRDPLSVATSQKAVIEKLAVPPKAENLVECPHCEDTKARSDAEFEAEARRIALELVKLYHAGVITGADDPNLVFYACLIRDFGGTVLPKEGQDTINPDDNPPPGVLVPGKTYTPTEEQRVRVPWGLQYEERQKFLQNDLDSLNDD